MVLDEKMNMLKAGKSKILNIPDTHIMNILVILNILPYSRFSIYSIFSHCQYGRSEYLAFQGHGWAAKKLKTPLHQFNAYIQCQRLLLGALTFRNDYNTRLQSIIRYYFQGNGNRKSNDITFYGVKIMEKTIEKLVKTGRIQDLIALPGADFNLAMSIIRRKHFEAQGFKYIDPDNPATCESCEG